MTARICDHKDCEGEASPIDTWLIRDGEVIDARTYYFCLEHRLQLHSLDKPRTLPPEEWFAPGYMPEIGARPLPPDIPV